MTLNRFFGVFVIALVLGWAGTGMAQDLSGDTKTFQRVFQKSRTIPMSAVDKVKGLPEGVKWELDRNEDGQVDELRYIDRDLRHTKEDVLVIVVDEDGDMAETMEGDRDSDLYFWDWGADGVIDVVTDYQDDDGDNDVDQMGIFYEKRWKDAKDDITVWWAVDIGDDNLLWYDVEGTYRQPLCQWKTHFSGDELFYQFRLSVDDEEWVNVWEDPFAFYDPDGDLCSEVVVRISAVGHDVKNLRYSIDADNDAFGKRTHNYDFSVTALPGEDGISSQADTNESLVIRGVKTHPAIPWGECKQFGQNAAWEKTMLSWDEINTNTDSDVDRDPNERWEGILNHASKFGDFEQVGGPPCSVHNKRIEVSNDHEPPIRLYYDKGDRRFHLQHTDYGYLDVDYNFDGEVDAAYAWKDTDGDGQLDVRTADVDNDGTIDFTQQLEGGRAKYEMEFESISGDYVESIEAVLEESQAFIDLALDAYTELPAAVADIYHFYLNDLPNYHRERLIGEDLRNTPAGNRFYLDLVRDRLFVLLKQAHGDHEAWGDVESAYLEGDYDGARKALMAAHESPDNTEVKTLEHGGQRYTNHIAVSLELDDPAFPRYDLHPVTLSVAALEDIDDDFNPDNCVVVAGERWLDWRVVAHQVDDWGFGPDKTLTFMADIQGEETSYFIFYGEGEAAHDFPKRTHAVLDNPAYVAWESDAGAFRAYTGQFDFFGKEFHIMLPPEERLIYPLIDVNYHAQQEWGIDALHVGETSGLGGLTLYTDGRTLPVQSPAGNGSVEFEYKVLGSGPVRSVVEMVATNVIPESPEDMVRIRAFIYAGREESEIQVRLPEGLKDPELAIGLQHVGASFHGPGYMGTWGKQGDDIGEIGMAVIINDPEHAKKPVELGHEQKLKTGVHRRYEDPSEAGYHLRYWIVGTWQRGMQYPVAPTVENWERMVEELGEDLTVDVQVHLK